MSGKQLSGKVIITVAPVGSIPTLQQQPNLPYRAEDVARETVRSMNEGASIVHLHARDPESAKPTSDVDVYRSYIDAIRAETSGIIIQLTTGGGAITLNLSPEERFRHIEELKPQMASLNAGSINFGNAVFMNPPDVIKDYARRMVRLGVKPEFEIYDVGMINNVRIYVKDEGIITSGFRFGLVMGIAGGIPANVKNLLHLKESLPADCSWQVIAMGRHQIPLGIMGALMGGGLRVGFEDNIYLKRGVLAESNAQLVEKATTIVREIGLEIASPDEAREILGI